MNKILIAKILAPHGIRGHLKIRPYTENIDDIFSYKKIFNDLGTEYKLKLVGYYKDNVIVKVNDIIDRNEAEKLVGIDLYISRSEFGEVESEYYYHSDLINIDVVNIKHEKIGVIKAVHNFGAGDILEIDFINDIKDNYFLFNKENFPVVDLNNKFIQFALS